MASALPSCHPCLPPWFGCTWANPVAVLALQGYLFREDMKHLGEGVAGGCKTGALQGVCLQRGWEVSLS